MHWHDHVPTHEPAPLHVSPDVQAMPSLHGCDAGAATVAGRAALAPERTAAWTQLLGAARHTSAADAGTNASGGHVLSTPLHDSLWSHGPAALRHRIVFGATPSLGHAAAVPALPVAVVPTVSLPTEVHP